MNFWQDIEKPIIGLSPMDGVTDACFRVIAAKHGRPDVIFTEFVNVETAFYAPHTLIRDLTYSEIERPVVAQIYGHTPEMFYKVAQIVCALGFDGLDINMGCPAKKVAAKGSGAALILVPELAGDIIRSAARGIRHWCEGQKLDELKLDLELLRGIERSNRLRTGLDTYPARRSIPLSVKTRLGYDDVVIEEWIQALLGQQPAVISLHGRTLKQMYKGNADWEAIGRAVERARNSGTLILGNGDLQNMRDVYRRVRATGVDGVLIGRGAQGDPWIFKAKERVKEALGSNDASRIHDVAVGREERFKVMLEHAKLFEKHWGIPAFVGMRKHLAWYCRGFPNAAELRTRLVRVNNVGEVAEYLTNYERSVARSLPAGDLLFHEHDHETPFDELAALSKIEGRARRFSTA
ncbi:MAG TPA: tRNA-dihydrouridine synthase [Candidatus Binatia bacterium]